MSEGRMTEREAKLELVASVALSQRAIARMLDALADLTQLSPMEAKAAVENIRRLTGLQEALTASVVGVRLCERKHGKPGQPWLAETARLDRRDCE